MAESCSVDMEVQSPSPQSSFSTFANKSQSCNFKKVFISVYNKEENLQEPPESPQATKPMPPLEPLEEMPSSHAFVPVHPKKRLKRECEDPMLAEAAASPMSLTSPCSPMSMLNKIGGEDDRIVRSPTTEGRVRLGSDHLFSGPNSPSSNLPSTLDPTDFSDSAYSSSGSLLSPHCFPFSPVSTTPTNSPHEFFPTITTLASLKHFSPQEDLSPLSPIKEKLDSLPQKHCPRPQSVALDLTALPKQNSPSEYAEYRLHLQQHQQPVNPPHPSSIAPMLNEGQKMVELRNGFQSVPSYPRGLINHTGHPRMLQQTFDRPTGVIPPTMQHKTMYNQNGRPTFVGPYGPRQIRMARLPEGRVAVIRPKPQHLYRRIPQHQAYHSQRGKPPILHPTQGSQCKRVPSSEMISYASHPVFPRDMPNIALPPPTALKKIVPWLHGEDSPNHNLPASITTLNRRKSQDDDVGFSHKPIHSWLYQDVIYFMFHAVRDLNITDQDLIISELSGRTGEDLCRMSAEDFKRFSPKNGEILYQYFMRKRQEETARVASSQQQDNRNSRLAPEGSPFQLINTSNNFFHPPHHPPPHPPPALVRDSLSGCDVSAPYKLCYETVDARSIGLDDNARRLFSGSLPSASGKTFNLLHAPSPAVPNDMDGNVSDPDQSSNEEEVKPEPPKKRGPGRPRKPENELKKKRKKTGRLWEFIRNLLLNPETCPSMVRWENAEEGVFRFVQAEKVAQRWGERKQNKEMNYEKLSRAMRYYYKGGVFEAVLGRRLVYKFGKNAKNWRPSNPNFTNHEPYPQSSSQ